MVKKSLSVSALGSLFPLFMLQIREGEAKTEQTGGQGSAEQAGKFNETPAKTAGSGGKGQSSASAVLLGRMREI